MSSCGFTHMPYTRAVQDMQSSTHWRSAETESCCGCLNSCLCWQQHKQPALMYTQAQHTVDTGFSTADAGPLLVQETVVVLCSGPYPGSRSIQRLHAVAGRTTADMKLCRAGPARHRFEPGALGQLSRAVNVTSLHLEILPESSAGAAGPLSPSAPAGPGKSPSELARLQVGCWQLLSDTSKLWEPSKCLVVC